MRKVTLLLALFALSCAPRSNPARSAVAAAAATSDVIPFDAKVRVGVLDNGLRYYVQANSEPKDRAVLRLVVDAGSILEDDDQQGLAHFVEHMAFNGTVNFPGNELIKYLEGTGTRFGAHLNAHTGFDETVYKLTVPTDEADGFAKSFQILEDWAQGLTFDADEIERERGVVLEEWRQGLGPWERVREATMPTTYADSRYPSRLPIGTEGSLRTFEHDALIRYYRTWYRPELMAVIAVGDFDVDAVEATIRQHFDRLVPSKGARERTVYQIPDRVEPAWLVTTDPEVPVSMVTVEAGSDWVLDGTEAEYRHGLVLSLVAGILGERFDELTRDPTNKLLGAGVGRGRRSPTEGAWVLQTVAQEGDLLHAYEVVLTEIVSARRFGFTQGEVDRARARMSAGLQKAYLERDKTDSRGRAEELVRHVTTGETVPGIEREWAMAGTMLPSITLDELHALIRDEYLPDHARVVMATVPEKDGLAPPTVEDLKAVEARVASLDLQPRVDSVSSEPLIDALPSPGAITASRLEEALGYTVWTLSNGAEVWLKPTDFKADQIEVRARSIGGSASVPLVDYHPAITAVEVMLQSGVGALPFTELRKRLAGTNVSVTPFISATHEGLRASAAPADLEVMMQLIYLAMTAPRFDQSVLEKIQRDKLSQLQAREADPAKALSDAHNALLWSDHPRYRPWSAETIAEMDLAKSAAFYKDRFGDASDFRFVFVGAFDVDAVRPLVEQYLASLPSGRAQPDEIGDAGVRRVTGRHERTVRAGADPKADVWITMHAPFRSTYGSRTEVSALSEVLSTRMREVMREDKGGVYGVQASLSTQTMPVELVTVTLRWTCDPERVAELEAAAFAVIDELVAAPVDASYVEAHRAKSTRSRADALRTNSFWAATADTSLDLVLRTGEPLDEVLNHQARLDALTPEVVHAAAKRYLTTDNVLIVRRLPAGE